MQTDTTSYGIKRRETPYRPLPPTRQQPRVILGVHALATKTELAVAIAQRERSYVEEKSGDEKPSTLRVDKAASVASSQDSPFAESPLSNHGVWVPPNKELAPSRGLKQIGAHIIFGSLEWLYSVVLMLVIRVLSAAKAWVDWREHQQQDDASEVELRKLQKASSFSVYQSVTQLRGQRSHLHMPRRTVRCDCSTTGHLFQIK